MEVDKISCFQEDFEQVIKKSYNDEIECILYEYGEVKSKHRIEINGSNL